MKAVLNSKKATSPTSIVSNLHTQVVVIVAEIELATEVVIAAEADAPAVDASVAVAMAAEDRAGMVVTAVEADVKIPLVDSRGRDKDRGLSLCQESNIRDIQSGSTGVLARAG